MASFDRERALQDAKPKRVKDGIHAFVITYAERHQKEGVDDLKAAIVLNVIKDIDDPNSVVPKATVRNWPALPINNDAVEGHKYREGTMERWVSYAAAIFKDDCPTYPRKLKKGRNNPFYFKDAEIDYDDYQTCVNEVVVSAGEKALEIWGNEGDNLTELVGKPFYAKIKNTDGPFPYVNPLAYLGEKDTVVDPAECMETVGDDSDTTTSTSDDTPKRRGRRSRNTVVAE